MQTKQGNQAEASLYRTKLINEFPNSKYKKILSQPDYTERLQRMYLEQDSIYNLTYKAYNESDFKTVYNHVAYIRQNYPLSTLMPKFLFLNALSIGKNDNAENFKTALEDLVKNYPESDVSAMSKDILALMKQGQEAKTGTTSGSLLARRDANTKSDLNELTSQQFSNEKQTKHRILLISSVNQADMNKMLYNIASFNFSRFIIKDFDLVINKLDSSQRSLSVTNFESYDEAIWYENSISTDVTLTKLLTDYHVQKVIISEENYALIKTGLSLNDYLAFQSNPPVIKQVIQIVENKTPKKQESVSVVSSNTTIPQKLKPEKGVDIALNKTEEKLTVKQTQKTKEKLLEQSSEKNYQTSNKVKMPDSVEKANPNTTQKQELKANPNPTVIQPKQEEVPLFKGLFGYRANEPHFVAIYILSGTIDFAKTKSAFENYNAKNYSIMNLKVSLETVGKLQVIIIGSLSDAQVAKSYLLRMVKEKSLFEGLKGSTYRNLLGSQKNLNTVIQKNVLNEYFEFMQEYYLK